MFGQHTCLGHPAAQAAFGRGCKIGVVDVVGGVVTDAIGEGLDRLLRQSDWPLLAVSPLSNRDTVTKPVVIGLLAFSIRVQAFRLYTVAEVPEVPVLSAFVRTVHGLKPPLTAR